ncbi:KH domain-containing protein [Bdellovibrio bacteriovorus]|nr:KH domain-containing protein [Bdellovibrio bacteriovorus]
MAPPFIKSSPQNAEKETAAFVVVMESGGFVDDRMRLAQLLKNIVQEMTSCPGEVEVTFQSGEKTTVYHITVPEGFRGKLIGAQGRNITALRGIIGAMAGNHGFRAVIELVA